jgi:hypothetical protein
MLPGLLVFASQPRTPIQKSLHLFYRMVLQILIGLPLMQAWLKMVF